MAQDEDFKLRIENILSHIELEESYSILLIRDALNEPGRYFIQLEKTGTDAIKGGPWTGRGERLFLSELMTDSEIANSIFDYYRLFHEHEARETFKWKGRAIFSPHRSMDGLWEGAKKLDLREDEQNEELN